MRKIIMLFLSLILVLSLAACGHMTDSNGSIPSPQLSATSDRGNERTKSTVSAETSSTGGEASEKDDSIKLTFGDSEMTLFIMFEGLNLSRYTQIIISRRWEIIT